MPESGEGGQAEGVCVSSTPPLSKSNLIALRVGGWPKACLPACLPRLLSAGEIRI